MKMEWMHPRRLALIMALTGFALAHPAPGQAVVTEIPHAFSPATQPVADRTEVSGAKISSRGLPSGQVRRTDRLIVKYKDPSQARAKTLGSGAVQAMSARAGVALTHLRAMSGDNQLFKLPKRMTPDEAQAIAQKLSADPNVEYAVPDRLMSPMLVPNDSDYTAQWDFKSPDSDHEIAGINLPPAWDITTGSSSLVIGVLDSGIVNHADLQGRILPGYNFISNPETAGNGVGRSTDASDLGDWVTSAESSDPTSEFYQCDTTNSSWHGTHVSGTIGATSNNGLGVTGINWNSKILPVRVLGKCGGYLSDIIDGMRWAAGLPVQGVPVNSNPARVLNMSLGGHGACDSATQNAINDVLAAGTVVVVAAGNNTDYAADYTPAGCIGVVSVAALNHAGGGTNYGPAVTIAAPGGESPFSGPGYAILSTLNTGITSPIASPAGDTYRYYEGTSMAAPHVTGVVSLMLSLQPTLTPAEVTEILQSTARPFPTATNSPGGDCDTSLCGAGIVDAYRSVQAVSSSAPIIGAAPLFLNFAIHPGDPNPPSQSIAITNPGGGTLNWHVSSNASWLQVSQSSGQESGNVTVFADTSSLLPGTNHTATITIGDGGAANASVTIPVSVKYLFKLRAPLLFPVADQAQAAINGKVYVIGGLGGQLGVVQIYDTASDVWTTGTPKPTATYATNAAVIDGKIYVPGGTNPQNDAVATLEIYDPATDQWSSGAPLPVPLAGLAVEAVDGKLYAVGGVNTQQNSKNATYVYDPNANTWKRLADMPFGMSWPSSGVLDGKIYLFAVADTYGADKLTEVFDTLTNSWSMAGSLRVSRYLGAGTSMAGRLYVSGGDSFGLQSLRQDFEVYDPGTDAWSLTPLSLNGPRSDHKATAVGNSIYVMGGISPIPAGGGWGLYSTLNESYDSTTSGISVTFAAGPNGSITGAASQHVDYAGSASPVTAVSFPGYHFVNWTGTGGFVATTSNPLTVSNVTANLTIRANFLGDQVDGACGNSNGGTFTASPGASLCATGSASAITGTGPWNWNCAGTNGGGTAACAASIQSFGITLTADANGTLAGAAIQTVNYGDSTSSVTAVPSPGYHFVNWTGTGGFAATTSNPLTVSFVTSNMIITANFLADTVNGACGGSNRQYFSSAPTANLCATGTASEITGAGPWSWSCGGGNGGFTAKCSTGMKGDVNGDGKVDVSDALLVLRIAIGLETATADMVARGDVAPLINGKPTPNGVIDIGDALILLKIVVGLVSW
jgi:serine protease